MNLLIDENMPRSLANELVALGFVVQDVREIELRGRPDEASTPLINSKIVSLLTQRLPESLLGAITFVESQRALSRIVRRRPKQSTTTQDQAEG